MCRTGVCPVDADSRAGRDHKCKYDTPMGQRLCDTRTTTCLSNFSRANANTQRLVTQNFDTSVCRTDASTVTTNLTQVTPS